MIKKIAVILIILMFSCSNSFAQEENVLSLDAVKQNINNNAALKKLDFGYRKLTNTHNMAWNVSKYINIAYMKMFVASLNQPVTEPKAVYYMGIPTYLDHTLSGIEKEEILDSLGIPYDDKGWLNMDLTKNLMPDRLSVQLRLMDKNKEIIKNQLELTAEQMFYGILLADEGIKLQQDMVDISTKQLNMAREKYKKGTISKRELDEARINYKQSLIKLDSQKRSRGNAVLTLNKLMSVPLTTNYDKLDGTIKCETYIEIDKDKMMENALKNRSEIFTAKENVRLKDLEFDIVKEYFDGNEYPEYRVVVKQQEQEKMKLEKAIEDIKLEITLACESIRENYSKVEKAQTELDSAQVNYNTMKARFAQGFITSDILDLMSVQINAAQMNLLGAINNYNISLKKLDAAVGVGPKYN